MRIAKDFGKGAAREASLLYVGGIICAVAAYVFWNTFNETQSERYALTGLSGIVAFVLTVWSLALACKATYRGAQMAWMLAVLSFQELSGFFFIVDELVRSNQVTNSGIAGLICWTGLPLFAPFFWTTSTVSAFVAYYRLRRNPKLTHSVYWRKWIRHFLIVTVVLTLALLPPLLFACCASWPKNWQGPQKTDWRDCIARNMPDMIRDSVVEILPHILPPGGYRCACSILFNGHCSRELLLEHIRHPLWWGRHDGDGECALRAFERLYPADMLDWALSNQQRGYDEWAGDVVAKNGTSEQVRLCLSNHLKGSDSFLCGLCFGLWCNAMKRPEFLPELNALVSDESSFHQSHGFCALQAIARLLPESEVNNQWHGYLYDRSHPNRRLAAINVVRWMQTNRLWLNQFNDEMADASKK